MQNTRLRIAMQKSGRLSKETEQLLKRCGLKLNFRENRLISPVANMPIDILRVRDDDIPGLVMDGVVDLGFIGENVLEEERLERLALNQPTEFTCLRRMDFGDCRLSLAVPEEATYRTTEDLHGSRIATSYPNLLRQYLTARSIQYSSCMLKGSVEVAPRAGLADAICDLVSTGATLEANGLKEVEIIFESKATLIQGPRPLSPVQQQMVDKLLLRTNGVIQAKESKYILLHAPKNQLQQVIDLLPGAENPTVLPLAHDDSRVALHVVSSEALFWDTMEQLKQLGASSILVLPIEKMLE